MHRTGPILILLVLAAVAGMLVRTQVQEPPPIDKHPAQDEAAAEASSLDLNMERVAPSPVDETVLDAALLHSAEAEIQLNDVDPDWENRMIMRTEAQRPLALLLTRHYLGLRSYSLCRHSRANPMDRYVAPPDRYDLDRLLAHHRERLRRLRAAIQQHRSHELRKLADAGLLPTANDLSVDATREDLKRRADAVYARNKSVPRYQLYINYLRAEIMARGGYSAFLTDSDGTTYLAKTEDLPETAELAAAGHMEHALLDMAAAVLDWFVDRGLMPGPDRGEVLIEASGLLRQKFSNLEKLEEAR